MSLNHSHHKEMPREMNTIDKPKTKKERKAIRQEKRTEIFAEVYALTNSPSKAMLAAEPTLEPKYAAVKAQRTLKKTDVQAKIQEKLEKMHRKALKKIDELIVSDNEEIATKNSWRVVEQLRGKPVARNLNVSATMNIEDALFD